jgi:hypothetical protein
MGMSCGRWGTFGTKLAPSPVGREEKDHSRINGRSYAALARGINRQPIAPKAYFAEIFREYDARPTNPNASSNRADGSGTDAIGVILTAKSPFGSELSL